jgi:hypothetical protein
MWSWMCSEESSAGEVMAWYVRTLGSLVDWFFSLTRRIRVVGGTGCGTRRVAGTSCMLGPVGTLWIVLYIVSWGRSAQVGHDLDGSARNACSVQEAARAAGRWSN